MIRLFTFVLIAGAGVSITFASPSRAKDESACEPALGKECPGPNEQEEFEGYAREIQGLQDKLAKGQPIARAFHRKAHGCLTGTFSVLADRPAQAGAGVFAETKDFPAIVRFSNASGRSQSDATRDMRGMAIKLQNVAPGTDQDFLMTNGPVHFAKDAKGMMEFAKASAGGTLPMGLWLITHLKGAGVLLKDTSRKVASMTTETYWSRVPILVGKEAVKFNATPCAVDQDAVRPEHPSATYLSDDLRKRAKEGSICFDFRVQFQRDPVKQPIEDASVEWKESDTPSVRVARLTLPVQQFDSTEQLDACEAMSFDPWHALPEHRPIGNMNRARKFVYPASAEYRKAHAVPQQQQQQEQAAETPPTPTKEESEE